MLIFDLILLETDIAKTKRRMVMERYKDLGGNSGVSAYEIGEDYIKVEFSDGSLYLYNYQSAGENSIEQMKSLALSGRGLNSFINKNVRKNYSSKLR